MIIQNRYEYDPAKDLLGKGGFARVFRAQDTLLHREVALKVFSNSGTHQYSVLAEIRKVIGLEHPNLLRYYDVVMLEGQNPLGESEQTQIGVMELANAGDLKDFARANPGSPLLYKLLKDVLHGLEYLHSKGIIHRDLKAQNILLVKQDGQLTAKISDFGISKDTGSGGQSSSMMVGTIEYMAPEQFSPAKYGIDGKVGSNLDLWSFGIMVHELLSGSTPFGSRDGDTTAEQIMSQILSTELPEGIDRLPEPYKSVVKKCLVANAKERIRRASELLSYFDGDTNSTNTATAQTDSDITKVYPKQASAAPIPNPQDQVTKVYGEKPPSRSQEKNESIGKTSKIASKAAIAAAVIALAGGGWWYSALQKEKAQARVQAQEKALAAAEAKKAEEAKAAADAKSAADAKLAAESKAEAEKVAKAKVDAEKVAIAAAQAKAAAIANAVKQQAQDRAARELVARNLQERETATKDAAARDAAARSAHARDAAAREAAEKVQREATQRRAEEAARGVSNSSSPEARAREEAARRLLQGR
jgi:serine/threonine protein kinase